MIDREKELKTIEHLFEMDRYEEAVPAIERLFELDPEDPAAFYNMAIVHFKREEYEQARNMCEQSYYFSGEEGDCLHFIGMTFEEEKRYQEAERAYLAAIEAEPENGDFMASYGYLMLLSGHDEKALKLLEEAKRLAPDSEMVNQYILQYYFAKSDNEQQIIHIQNVMETASSEMQNLLNLGLFYMLKKDYREAREYYRHAFLLDPTNKDLLEILEDLDELTHPIFFPARLVEKIGGGAVLYLAFFPLILLFKYMNLYQVALPLISIYLLLCIYTWVDSFIYKQFVKGKF